MSLKTACSGVEKLTENDLGEIKALIEQSLGSYRDHAVIAASFRRLDNFWDVYNRESTAYFVSKKDGKVVAGVGLGVFAGLPPSEGIAEMRELVVAKSFRGMGYAKALIQMAVDFAKGEGYRQIYLETTPQMESARSLFKSIGFLPVEHASDPSRTNHEIDGSKEFPFYYRLDL